MVTKVERYLEDMKNAWAPKTLHNTKLTLGRLLPVLTGDPQKLWDELCKTQSDYTRVMTWGKVCGFWDYAEPDSRNPYRDYRKKNARLFRDKYLEKTTSETAKSAREKIASITNPSIKRKAMELLLTGMRYTESLTLKDGVILGKGDRKRKINVPEVEGPEMTCHYKTFYNALRDVGLKPHTLRKIYLTECVRKGANVFQLKKLAGWKSLQSAVSYIDVDEDSVREIQERVRKGSE
jgi:integrase